MGTRNTTIVISEGETKVAQYCQFDGYPSGQGITVLHFLRRNNIEKFKRKVDALGTYTTDEVESLWRDMGADDSGFVSMELSRKFAKKYPHLHRNTGANILDLIHDGKVTKVKLDEDFIDDGLFCEWAYVINLDKGTLEIKNGADKTYSLDNLPSDEKFLEELDDAYDDSY